MTNQCNCLDQSAQNKLSMSLPSESTPLGKAILDAGALAVASAAFIGVGSLAYYALGFSPEASALQNINTNEWSQEVKTRLQHTYVYFFLAFYICMIFAYLAYSNSTMSVCFSSFGMVVVDFFVEILVDSGNVFTRLSDVGIVSVQRLAWIAYCAFLGGITSPSFYRDVATMRVAMHTTLLVAGTLIFISLVAPIGKFTKWRVQLQIFEMVVLISAMCTNILPVTTSIGALFIAISFYGGLILSSLNILYHSQRGQLEASSENHETPYSCLAMSIPLLTNTLSIFNRIVAMVPLE